MEALRKQQERENVKMIMHDIAKIKPKRDDYHNVSNQLERILNNASRVANLSGCDSPLPCARRRPGANSVRESTERGINRTNRISESENYNSNDVGKYS